MSVFKCFTALWVSIIIYSVLSAFLGAASFSSYKALTAERDRFANNMENLKNINRDLEGSVDALLYDSDTISVYARELGYGAEDERFVRIVGLPVASKKSVAAGSQIVPVKPDFIPDRDLRIISAFAGIFTLIIFIAADLRKRRKTTAD